MIKEFGYEYDAKINEALFNETKGCVTQNKFWNAICLRSGRDALATIAREFNKIEVLLPALSCESMGNPFIKYNHKINYYRLNKDYSIDIADLTSMIKNKKTIFLYMDYFGIPAIQEKELFDLKKVFPNLIFVEDITHTLLYRKKQNFIPDFKIASLRKWINIPDGGLLWNKHELKNKAFSNNLDFAVKRLEAQKLKSQFMNNGNQNFKKKYRMIFSTVTELIDKDFIPTRMSEYSYRLAKRANWELIKNKRKENFEVLESIISKSGIKIIQKQSQKSDLYLPILVDNRDEKQNKLAKMGIYNTIIWPLNSEQRMKCEVAKYTEENMLASPCDQRYTKKDMEYIGKEMVKIINE